MTYSRVDSGRGQAALASRQDGRREPRLEGDDDRLGIEPRMAPAFDAEHDYGPEDQLDLAEVTGERTPWGLRVSMIGGAIAIAVGVGLLVFSVATATIGVRSPDEGEAALASETQEPVAVSGSSDGAPGSVREVSPFGRDTASSTSTSIPAPSDAEGPAQYSAAEPEPAPPPPAPRTRPDRQTVASTEPSAEPASARSDTTVTLTAPAAPPSGSGTDALIADIERILGDGRAAQTVDGPAMDVLPPSGGVDASATGAIVLAPPGATAATDPYGPPLPHPPASAPSAEIYGPPPYPPPLYPPGAEPYGPPPYPLANDPTAPRLQPGQLYIPPAPGAPVPPADIPGVSGSTSVF